MDLNMVKYIELNEHVTTKGMWSCLWCSLGMDSTWAQLLVFML